LTARQLKAAPVGTIARPGGRYPRPSRGRWSGPGRHKPHSGPTLYESRQDQAWRGAVATCL